MRRFAAAPERSPIAAIRISNRGNPIPHDTDVRAEPGGAGAVDDTPAREDQIEDGASGRAPEGDQERDRQDAGDQDSAVAPTFSR